MGNPTSVRLTDAELELLNVHREILEHMTGTPPSMTEAFRYLLRENRPHPSASGPLESKLRRAYKAAFG